MQFVLHDYIELTLTLSPRKRECLRGDDYCSIEPANTANYCILAPATVYVPLALSTTMRPFFITLTACPCDADVS